MLYAQVHLSLPAWVHEAVDPLLVYDDDASRIALAIRLARLNVEHGSGGPFGAAVFDARGRLLSVGVNAVERLNCSVAHAEIMALISAQHRVQRFRLNQDGQRYVLATSAQPCCQCYGASFWAGIDELLIAARSDDVTELAGFDEGPLPADWIGELARRGIAVKRDLEREAARDVLALYRARGGAVY